MRTVVTLVALAGVLVAGFALAASGLWLTAVTRPYWWLLPPAGLVLVVVAVALPRLAPRRR